MVEHLFSDFLDDSNSYRSSQDHWGRLWLKTDPVTRSAGQWQEPWMAADPRLRDGNPIFTAWSPALQKGIRVIQHPPTSQSVEIQFWFDTFEVEDGDSGSIRELVIACALSTESTWIAFSLIDAWLAGNVRISFSTMRAFPTELELAYPVIETAPKSEAA